MRQRLPHRARACAAVISLLAIACLWPIEAARPLAGRVTIARDRFGVPHITAETEEAAGFGLGYAQAEDHIEVIGRLVLEARGVSAREFGASQADGDFSMRRARNLEEAATHVGELDGTYREVLRAFAAGVNHYVAQHRSSLPQWVPETSAADFIAIPRRAAAGSIGAPALVRALQVKYGIPSVPPLREEPAELPDEPGSNAFALAGSRTASGHPILLGNPHLRWSNLYWEAHVTVPGRLNFYGSTLAGLPWLRAGFNERIAYVQTNNAPDLSDLFALPLDPERPDAYLFEGSSRPLDHQAVTIEIRRADGSIARETRSYWGSHLGPVVYRTGSHAFAYRSTSLDAFRFFEGFWRLSHARNLEEFREVLGRKLMPSSNFTYADAAGNIFYFWNARLPRRREGVAYELDVPASTRQYVWSDLHAAAELPQLLNPPGGCVQNANNPPWFTSRADGPAPDRYPAYVERGELSLRAQLALDLLGSRERFAPEDVIALKFSPRLLLAERVNPELLRAIDAALSRSPDVEDARRILGSWDGTASATSTGSVLFQRFWELYRHERRGREPFAHPWDPAHPYETPSGLADPVVALESLDRAVKDTRQQHGSAGVPYGEVNRFRLGGVDLPGDGASGQLGAYRVVQFDPSPDGRKEAGRPDPSGPYRGYGDAWVLLVHFTRPVSAYSVLAYGQSSRAHSPHGTDQISLYAAHRLRPVWFTTAAIDANTERRYRPDGSVPGTPGVRTSSAPPTPSPANR